MSDNLLVVINNDKIFQDNNEFFSNNYNLKILPEGLNNYHKQKLSNYNVIEAIVDSYSTCKDLISQSIIDKNPKVAGV